MPAASNPSAMTSTRASDCRSRYSSSNALYRLLQVTVTAPMRATATLTTFHAGALGIQRATWSPGPSPSASKPRAKASTRSRSSR
jgi:hypothetical protein